MGLRRLNVYFHGGHDDDDDFHGEMPWFDPGAAPGEGEEDVEGLEKLSLHSVGIDIGSSTSHLVFSYLTLRREGSALSARFTVADRRVTYRSPILLTPYVSGVRVDVDRLTEFFHTCYHEAGLIPEDVDTGAVVITGEALKKENAQPILEYFARESGKFICASAGPNHEALLAAYGCGAVALSQAEHANVLNVDMGGGTTKITLVRNGNVEQTVAVEVGARLLAFGEDGRVTRVEEPARVFLKELGATIALGDRLDEGDRKRFVGLMASVLFEILGGGHLSALAQRLLLTEPLCLPGGLDEMGAVVFSGGVSEYVYGRETRDFGDQGRLLAEAIHERLSALGHQALLREPVEGIRATVIGAGEYTVQVSGNTSYIGTTDVLPAYALKVVRPALNGGDSVETAVKKALARFDLDAFGPGLALALSLDQPQDYASVRQLAEGIAASVEATQDQASPLILVLDMDVALSLGAILKEELGVRRPVIALDGIDVGDLDYVDVGQPIGLSSQAIPVTIKSLLFPSPSPQTATPAA